MIRHRKTRLPILVLVLVTLVFPAVPAAAGTLTFPGRLKAVPAEAFYGDTSIQTAVLQDGVTCIGSKAFADSALREITLPSSLTCIADDAFDGSALKTVHVEKDTYAYQWMRDNGYISEYRALLIGEQRFLWYDDDSDPDSGCWLDDTTQRNIHDVRNLAAALGNTAGPHGVYGPEGDAIQVTRKTNLTWSGIRSAIRNTFADTRDQDISIFFIATHGNSSGDGDLRTAFTGSITNSAQVASYWPNRYLSFSTLASWLNSYVKGKVFVILESCGAGSSIYRGYTLSNSTGPSGPDSARSAEAFVSKAVEAFSTADFGIDAFSNEAEGFPVSNSTGDLRLPRFYVLAACQHQENCYGQEDPETETYYNYFTKWLIKGIGRKNASPADADGNNVLNLSELYDYIKKYDSYSFVIGSQTFYQHVRCYPEGSICKLLKLVQ